MPTNKPMKRLSLYLFLILFTLQTPSQADDIRDFQIEGITVGDSLLDFYNEKKIKEAIKDTVYYYPDRKFYDIFIKSPNNSNYEWFQITMKTKDKSYIVYVMTGLIDFEKKNMKDCYPKLKEVANEIKNVFDNKIKPEDIKFNHTADTSGKSKVERSNFKTDGGDIQVECVDWSKNVEYEDTFRVNIKSDEALKYFRTAFK